MSHYLKVSYKDGDSLFTGSHMEKTMGIGYKQLPGRFQLDTRVNFFTTTISHFNNLPMKTVDSLKLDSIKIQLDGLLGHLVQTGDCGFAQKSLTR